MYILLKTYLNSFDDCIFVDVVISSVHDADDFRPTLLSSSYRSPQYSFTTTTSVTIDQINYVRHVLVRKHTRRDERSPRCPSNLYSASLRSVLCQQLHPPSPNHRRPNLRDLGHLSPLLLTTEARAWRWCANEGTILRCGRRRDTGEA